MNKGFMWPFSAKSIEIKIKDEKKLNFQLKYNYRPRGQFFFKEY